ncbi:hypothetical protein NLG97_g4688 [Lecanicillium saksenae]|uniref:Uncharacterized protein n=1 Tax=Lecanicillium saksenae TaxID=468837 RepID=A0ACC1QXQ1_9HYPO|nr:hypothetical protein NLG97_g4688 [Lecanicillium saksenae]
MHYIRLLRPPKVTRNAGQHLELLFTITTDLGDSFLYPEIPIDLQIIAEIHESHTPTVLKLTKKSQVVWQSGMRVAKPKIVIPRPLQAALSSGAKVNIGISANQEKSADGAQHVLLHSENSGSQGQIMPVWATLNNANAGTGVSTRRIVLDDAASGRYLVEVEEEIGESIARHIWDAGVLAMCCIAGIYLCPTLECNQQRLPKAMKALLSSKKALNVLELGCGVGILGLGFATVFPRLRKEGLETCTIVMTDLEEAEERTKSNMERALINGQSQDMSLLYENLDWEEGRKGVFGTEVAGRGWDLIIISDCTYNVDMLPALVETLTALEMANRLKKGSIAAGTKVFLATKPRHASERAFFDLMSDNKWRVQENQILDLPVLGNENESIELYLFERQ